MEESRKKYADIIDLPHHQSDTRPKMWECQAKCVSYFALN